MYASGSYFSKLYVLVGAFAVSGNISFATVLEFDSNGKVIVTETHKSKSKNNNSSKVQSPASAAYRALAQDIALQYSGSIGVRKSGLDAITFAQVFEALIENESAFNPDAASEKGAQGLGQLMPKTASDLGVSDPFNPEQNLHGSAKYFTQQLSNFGSLELALAAYNAGPERVKQYDGVPPFPETKAYIASIYKFAGLDEPNYSQSSTVAVQTSLNNEEQPLIGETSVWEF